MNTQELLIASIKQLRRLKWLVIAIGLGMAVLLFFFARSKRPIFTAKSTVFPLTNAPDNSLTSGALSSILGLSETPKSFSSEASINIIELALSRNVREAVAMTRLPEFGNETIVKILFDDINAHKPFYGKSLDTPKDSTQWAILGGEILKPLLNAKMSKNGVLELYFSSVRRDLVTPISYAIIDRISRFYIDLKIKKAMADYDFTIRKIDSLQQVVAGADQRAIALQNATFFAPEDRLEYILPKENLNADRNRVNRQRDIAQNNREEALWRLQKATPIISVLDKPTEPFTVSKSSPIVYAIFGFMLGMVLGMFIALRSLLVRYVKDEIRKSIFGSTE